jgi:hypothetical protein
MTQDQKDFLDRMTEHERDFLKSEGIEPNEHGAYVFENQDSNVLIALDMFLYSYRNWLIENRIVKEL